jgi:hypothetical protein
VLQRDTVWTRASTLTAVLCVLLARPRVGLADPNLPAASPIAPATPTPTPKPIVPSSEPRLPPPPEGFDGKPQIRLNDWRRSQGAALRMSWNLATIITTEYAFSQEDSAFYVNFNHMF